MKCLLVLVLAASSLVAMDRKHIDEMITQQRSLQKRGVKGLLFQQKIEPQIELMHPDSLFRNKPLVGVRVDSTGVVLEVEGVETAEFAMAEEPRPIHSPPRPSGNFVPYQVYYKKMMEMSERIVKLETELHDHEAAIVDLSKVTKNVHELSVDNREFVLKMIEIILAGVIGSGGIGSVLFAKSKNKKQQTA